jgi:GGDEF domain-containing protein
MIKLEPAPGTVPHAEELEISMYFMEQSIRQAVRGVDVVTRYSRQQFLIILLGTDDEGVKTAMDRIFRGYYKMNGSNAFTPSYSVADPIEDN